MEQRTLPVLDRSVGAIGLGCMGISWAYVAPEARDEAKGTALIGQALDRGVTFFDTSDAYAAGHNEQVVARGITGRRGDAVVATKVGLVVDESADGEPRLRRDGRPEHIRAGVDASLGRLGIEAIDLYYLHRVDPDVPLEESWGTMAELVTAGKVRSLGLSEVTVDEARRAHAIHPVAAVQSEFSLWTRGPLGDGTTPDGQPTGDMVGWTAASGAAFVPFSPLGRGFLTGNLDTTSLHERDLRRKLPRFTGDAADANRAIVDGVRRVAVRHETTAAAVALAWVLAQGEHIIPIPGTTKLANLEGNIAATEIALTGEDFADLDALPAAVGTRY